MCFFSMSLPDSFFLVILGLSFLMSLPDSFFLVILGLEVDSW